MKKKVIAGTIVVSLLAALIILNDNSELVRKPINMRYLKEKYYGSFSRGF